MRFSSRFRVRRVRNRAAGCLAGFLLAVVLPGTGEPVYAQSANDVLRRATEYHDPSGAWESGRVAMTLKSSYSDEMAEKRGYRSYEVNLTFAVSRGIFRYESRRPGSVVEVACDGLDYSVRLNGSADITDAQREEHRLQPTRLAFYRNYYEYLFGLRLPKARAWYMNNDGEYLGTDEITVLTVSEIP